jgi:hypothetical protein
MHYYFVNESKDSKCHEIEIHLSTWRLQIWLLIVTVGVTVTIHYWWAWWIVLIPLTVGLTPLLASMVCSITLLCTELSNFCTF